MRSEIEVEHDGRRLPDATLQIRVAYDPQMVDRGALENFDLASAEARAQLVAAVERVEARP